MYNSKATVVNTVLSFLTIRVLGERSDQQRPHIITIIADDLGWNDVSFHGSDQIPTPNIDALGANGVILNRYYVQPTCTPSRTAYLTGQYPHRNGMQGNPLSPGERWGIPLRTPLLPEHLRNLGYTTRLVGKWHVGYYTVDHTPTRRGFDSFFGYYNGYMKYFDHTIRKKDVTAFDLHRDNGCNSTIESNGTYFTDLVTREVEEIIKGHDVSRPLYLQVAHLAVHAGEPEEPVEVWNVTEVNQMFGYIKDINRRKYAGMVSRLDKSVGRIVRALRKAGMLENSIVIFTTDNGAPTVGLHENYGSNYPLRGQKATVFDGGVRGTACLYSPLLNRSSKVSYELMHITDWMPTLYSAAGGDIDDLGNIDGVDQWTVLKEGGKSSRYSALLTIDEVANVSGAILGRFKLLKGHYGINSDFYGDEGVATDWPPYHATSVAKSTVGKSIAKISNNVASTSQIRQLRTEAQISCPSRGKYVDCVDTCLFDMTEDPCETVDVSSKYPEMVKTMEDYVASYFASLRPQSPGDYDPNASAEKFGGAWIPWIGINWNDMTEYFVEGISNLSARNVTELACRFQ